MEKYVNLMKSFRSKALTWQTRNVRYRIITYTALMETYVNLMKSFMSRYIFNKSTDMAKEKKKRWYTHLGTPLRPSYLGFLITSLGIGEEYPVEPETITTHVSSRCVCMY
jgi:hypothetical protein